MTTQPPDSPLVEQVRDAIRAGTPTACNPPSMFAATEQAQAVIAVLQPLLDERGWRDIESAPEGGGYLVFGAIVGSLWAGDYAEPEPSGTYVVDGVFTGSEGRLGRFLIDHGGSYDYGYATHWMPLPEPPESKEPK